METSIVAYRSLQYSGNGQTQIDDDFSGLSLRYVVVFGCRVFCGTWNVNGQEPSGDLREWLSARDEDRPPDIYAIGSMSLH